MILIITIILLFAPTVHAGDTDFRSSRWGMSKLDVMAVETAFYVEETADALLYQTDLLNKEVFILYKFYDDKLVKAWYHFNNTYTDTNLHIYDYHEMITALTNKYGTPEKENINWFNKTYETDENMFGYAISMGHLILSCEWELERTSILCQLSGEDYVILKRIEYTSKLHTDLIEEFRKAKKKDTVEGL